MVVVGRRLIFAWLKTEWHLFFILILPSLASACFCHFAGQFGGWGFSITLLFGVFLWNLVMVGVLGR